MVPPNIDSSTHPHLGPPGNVLAEWSLANEHAVRLGFKHANIRGQPPTRWAATKPKHAGRMANSARSGASPRHMSAACPALSSKTQAEFVALLVAVSRNELAHQPILSARKFLGTTATLLVEAELRPSERGPPASVSDLRFGSRIRAVRVPIAGADKFQPHLCMHSRTHGCRDCWTKKRRNFSNQLRHSNSAIETISEFNRQCINEIRRRCQRKTERPPPTSISVCEANLR